MKQYIFKATAVAIFSLFLCTEGLTKNPAHPVEEKTKIYIMYSPSHATLANEWFRPSVLAHDKHCEIIETLLPQECASGRFYDKGWKETTARKFDVLIEATKENMGKIFIYSDVDIQFFAPFSQYAIQCLGEKDVAFQQDSPQYGISACTGFIVCRANEKTLSLWQKAKALMKKERAECDQRAVWQVLYLSDQMKLNPTSEYYYGVKDLDWGLLPWQQFFGPGMATYQGWKKGGWQPGDYFSVPDNIIMHHANFTIGLENKIAQLAFVQDRVNK